MTKVGILSVPPSLDEVVRLARDAEAAGFDSVWTGEYFSRNAFTTLAAVAVATRAITIGSSIAYAFLRSPVQLAMAAADVDELSGGRLVLGLATGTRGQNEQWYGAPFEHPGPRLRETVEISRALWGHRGGPFRHQGRFFSLSIPNFVRHRQARERIPIYLGAANPYTLSLVGEVADGLLGHPTYTRRYYREVILPSLERGLVRAAKRPDAVERLLTVVTVVDRDRERARRDAAMWLTFYYAAKVFHRVFDLHGWEEEKNDVVESFRSLDPERMAGAISDRMWEEVLTLCGTPDDVRRSWKEVAALADHVLLLAPAPYGGVSFERYRENTEWILEVFGRNRTTAEPRKARSSRRRAASSAAGRRRGRVP